MLDLLQITKLIKLHIFKACNAVYNQTYILKINVILAIIKASCIQLSKYPPTSELKFIVKIIKKNMALRSNQFQQVY